MRAVFVCVVLLLAALAVAGAAETGEADANYLVQPGDTLHVWLWNESVEGREIVVGAEGTISFPPAGALQVKGMTTGQIEAAIAAAVRQQRIKNPRVTVALKARKARTVSLLGAVVRPGVYELPVGARLRDAIGLAGGLGPDADGARASVSSSRKGTIPVDLEKLLVRGDNSQDLILNPGDVLTVPSRERSMLTILVVGQVMRPGTLHLSPGTRLSDAMTAAGGPTPIAALKKASMARSGLTVAVDLDAVLRKGDLAGNIPLQDGDVLLVPEGRNQVTLVGEFVHPGTYPFKEGDSLVTGVVLGGGAGPEADLRKAVLSRGGKETTVDLHAMLKKGDMRGDQPLMDGDVLILPQARIEVSLVGEFMRPGTYPFKEGDTLITAVALGGGLSPLADLQQAVLKREGKEIPIDLKAMLKQGDMKQDQPLQRGDVLVVPPGVRIYAYGAFVRPGLVTVTRDMKLVDILLSAGGALRDARLEKAEVVRMVDGKPVRKPLNVRVAVERGGTGYDFPFQDGDVLVMPAKGARIDIPAVLNTLSTLAWFGINVLR